MASHQAAIIIKGSSPDSKSYFTSLPGTLDELVLKASKLFPVPPNHTAHLLLDNDAILMPDVLPFLKDREVLTFRFTANTPRSSLRQPSRAAEELARQASSSGSSNSSHASHHGSDRTVRGVRWDTTVTSSEDRSHGQAQKPMPQQQQQQNVSSSSSHAISTSAKPYRYSAAARAEHSRRVLSEQDQRRRQEEAEKRASVPSAESAESSIDDPFKYTALPQNRDRADAEEKDEAKTNRVQKASDAAISADDLLASGSSPPPYASTASAKAQRHDRMASDEEQNNSSPIASPTRNIRGAQNSINEWMSELGIEKPMAKSSDAVQDASNAPAEPSSDSQELQVQVLSAPARDQCESSQESAGADAAVEEDSADRFHQNPIASQAPEQAVAKSELNEEEWTHVKYQRMSSIVKTLREHPANQHFHQSVTSDPFLSNFLTKRNANPVDFDTISDRLASKDYGREDPFSHFVTDLNTMWTNSRQCYGPASPQAQCADFLERFSRIITVEWRREGESGRKIGAARDKAEAMARAAKVLHSLSHGISSDVILPAPRKSAANAGAIPKKNSGLVRPSQPDFSMQTFTMTQAGKPQRGQVRSDGLAKAITERSTEQTSPKQGKGEIALTPRTHAFLATLFAKGNSAATPTSASVDMMAKLREQFKAAPFVPTQLSNNGRSPLQSLSGKRGLKRAVTAVSQVDSERPAKKSAHVSAEDITTTAQEEPIVQVPTVTVTAEPVHEANAKSEIFMSEDVASLYRPHVDSDAGDSIEGIDQKGGEKVPETVTDAAEQPSVRTKRSPKSSLSSRPHEHSPRRSPRVVTPSKKSRNSSDSSTSSYKSAQSQHLQNEGHEGEQLEENEEGRDDLPMSANRPQRNIKRRLTAAEMGLTRPRRVAAV